MSASRVKPEVDLSQPASLVLRAGTIGIHDEISNSKTATYLTKGELDREEYVRYLMMLWHVYKCVCSRRRLGVLLILQSASVLPLGCSKRV